MKVPAEHCRTCTCPPVDLILSCGCEPDAHPNDWDGMHEAHPEVVMGPRPDPDKPYSFHY